VIALLRALLRIGLLKSGPQSLPASRELAYVVIAAHFAVGLGVSFMGEPVGIAFLSAASKTLILVGFIQALLLLRGYSGRFYQTVTAMGGCELIIAVAALPFGFWFDLGAGRDLAAMFLLVLVGWSLAIAAHIFHHSLEVNRFAGFGLSLAYLYISYIVAGLITAPGA
jgi:hypothetical protein